MNGIVNLLKTLYRTNKLFFVIALAAAIVVLAGCSVQGSGAPPPSGPIGGGCG